MRKFLSILFVGVFLYACLGYFVVFQVLQFQAKKEIKTLIKSKIPKSELTIIKYSELNMEEYIQIEKNDEFVYKGKLYDLVKKEIHGNDIFYYCLNDRNEETLFANLDSIIHEQISNNVAHNKNTKKILQKIEKVYLFEKIKFLFISSFEAKSILSFNLKLNSVFIKTVSPPPKFI